MENIFQYYFSCLWFPKDKCMTFWLPDRNCLREKSNTECVWHEWILVKTEYTWSGIRLWLRPEILVYHHKVKGRRWYYTTSWQRMEGKTRDSSQELQRMTWASSSFSIDRFSRAQSPFNVSHPDPGLVVVLLRLNAGHASVRRNLILTKKDSASSLVSLVLLVSYGFSGSILYFICVSLVKYSRELPCFQSPSSGNELCPVCVLSGGWFLFKAWFKFTFTNTSSTH